MIDFFGLLTAAIVTALFFYVLIKMQDRGRAARLAAKETARSAKEAARLVVEDAERNVQRLESEYKSALVALSENPSDRKKRIEVLEKGRVYMEASREFYQGSSRTIFDEVALQNDLSAYGALDSESKE